MGALRQDQVHLAEGAEQGGRIAAPRAEAARPRQQRVKGREERRAPVGGARRGNRPAGEDEAVVVVVLVVAAGDGEPARLVLDVGPEQIGEGLQRVGAAPAAVLKASADGVEAADQHPLLVPVRPDRLQEAGPARPGHAAAVGDQKLPRGLPQHPYASAPGEARGRSPTARR